MFRVMFLLLVVALSFSYATDPTSVAASPVASLVTSGKNFEPVVFSAVRAADKSRKSVQRLLFENTITDIGFGWSPLRSEFVCFYPGTYFFSFTALSDNTSNFKVALMKNNDDVVYAWGERVGHNSGSNTAILTLAKDDRVYLQIQEGTLHETKRVGRGYTSFSGFRIA